MQEYTAMKNKQTNQINRRNFLQLDSAFVATILLLPFAGKKAFGFPNAAELGVPIPSKTLNNGLKMPLLGFGTYGLRGETCARSVTEALSAGYRLLDTATIYGNEDFVGAGIKNSGIRREDVFITSKVWVDDSGYDKAKAAFEVSIKKLGTEYLDLYLIHRPRGDVKGSWQAMEDLYKEGKIKAIGISNFEPNQLTELMTYAKVKPAVNQIETHAFFQQNASYDVLQKQDIQTEAWAPFAEGRNGLFTNETLTAIGKKYNKSTAQVSLRWHFQRDIVAIPRSSQKVHILENLDIFDFELSKADMELIADLDLNITQFPEWS
jgi:2,5-diketo-D-gluconate reductase A